MKQVATPDSPAWPLLPTSGATTSLRRHDLEAVVETAPQSMSLVVPPHPMGIGVTWRPLAQCSSLNSSDPAQPRPSSHSSPCWLSLGGVVIRVLFAAEGFQAPGWRGAALKPR